MDRASTKTLTCSKGHALVKTTSATNLPSNYPGGRYICSTCGNNYTCSSTPVYHCRKCEFDICDPCYPVQQALADSRSSALSNYRVQAVTCTKGHILVKTTDHNNLPSNYKGGHYICSTCGNNYKCSDTPVNHCRACQFDICDHCYPVQQTIINTCDRGHKLYKVNNLYIFNNLSSYKNNRYICSLCPGRYSAQKDPSLHCALCEFDICPPCSDSSHLVCRVGHHLVETGDLRPQGYPDNIYNCDECGKNLDASRMPSHNCKRCNYDLCGNCSKVTDLVCDRGHRLHKTNDLSHNPGYVGNRYRCSICDGVADATTATDYHCAPCEYDLCPRCVADASIPKGKAQVAKNAGTVTNHMNCVSQMLVTKCPSRACTDKGNTKKYAWTCSKCSKGLTLCADAYVSCECVSSFVINWRFDCGEHNAQFKLNVDDVTALYTASVVTDMAENMAQIEFKNKLKNNIQAAFNKKV